jgi:hypothetical protein
VLHAQIDVLTNRYDAQRTGANLRETTLTANNVNPSQFGKLYSYPVDGSVYAQPLYASNVTIGGVVRNVLYIATMNDKVYAFDADSASATPLWAKSFVSPPSVTAVPISDITAPGLNIVGNVGVQSTPVIDRSSNTIYLVARTKENGNYVQRLHAMDITTGQERSGSPVVITGSVPGSASDATAGLSGQEIRFDPKVQVQRAGLALVNGVVLVAWAAHEDLTPSHGWIMGFDSATLKRVITYAVTPDVDGGGIWQGGRAPAIDTNGNVYFATGNGKWDGTRNFGDSLLKFSVSRSGMTLLDYFTPGNEAQLAANDDDLSGSGFTLLPGTSLLLGGGKEGVLYLLNANSLGHKVTNDTQIVQRLATNGGHVMGGPVYWNSATAGPLVYNWGEDDVLKAYRLSGGRLATTPYAQGQVVSPGHPGGSLTVSASGSTANTGIVWASMPTNQDGMHGLVAGVLRAFHADTLGEIWNSEINPTRDRVGTLMKFVPPTVANGRVYVPNHDNSVAVYGLLSPGSSSARPGAISIDFVGNAPRMAPTEIAGVVAKSHWNNKTNANRTSPAPLMDETGAAVAATVLWTSNNTWMTPITDQPGSRRMVKGYIDTSSTSTTKVTVAGLELRTYDIYVYVDGDNHSYTRTGAYTISGSGITTTTVNATDAGGKNFSGGWVQANNSAGNYVKFRIRATGFTLTARPVSGSNATLRAPINGIQIVPIP